MNPNQKDLILLQTQPIWSKVDLAAAKPLRFFNAAGPNANGNIDSANMLDMNADFYMNRFEFNLMKTDGSAMDATTLGLVAKLIKEGWINFQKNSTEKVWQSSLSMLLTSPILTAAAGASAYNPVGVLHGILEFEEIVKLPGGENINVTLNWEPASDYTGLTGEMVLHGNFTRVKKAERA